MATTIQGYDSKVVMGDAQLDSFQEYQDAALAQARRGLDPQQEALQSRFAQTMVNKGLAPGSEAYMNEFDNMSRAMNDQDIAAQFGAMQFGQGAQNQAYNQALGASQLAQGMSLGELAAETARANAQLAADTSRYGISTAAGTAAAQLAQQGTQFQDQFGFDQNRWGDQFGLQQQQFAQQQQQADFNNLMNLGTFGINYGNYMNNAAQTDYNMAAAMLSNVPGNQQQQINVGGAYNTAQSGAVSQAQFGQNAAQATWSGIGDLAGAAMFLSSMVFKDVKGEMSNEKKAMMVGQILSMPMYEWEYLPEFQEKDEPSVRYGPLAEDFRKIMGNSKLAQQQIHIDAQRWMAGLHMTVQEMAKEIRRLEGLVWYIANRTGKSLNIHSHLRRDGMSKADTLTGKASNDVCETINADPGYWTQHQEIEEMAGTALVRSM